VAPGLRGGGLGRRLYRALIDRLAPHAPRNLSLGCWEQQSAGLAWLRALGFSECLREAESSLDLGAFDPAPYRGRWTAVERAGFRLRSLAELGDTPARRRQVYALDMDLSLDIPTPGPFTAPDFAIYEHLLFALPGYRPEHCWLALEGDEPVALSWHALGTAAPGVKTCITGVRRDRRGRGLALALKSRALAALAAAGEGRVSTRNAVSNTGMLAVNARLGYRPCGARITVHKEMET
jgi:GNAT superfamily N-acetyltransferase